MTGRAAATLGAMSLTIRSLTAQDMAASWDLGRLAFGGPAQAPPRALDPVPGVTRYGAFDSTGRLVGRATDVGHEQWWGGRRVVAADIGGVAVIPEARGGGVARAVLAALLEGARERGAAVSALYPTVSPVYRALGWEVCGTLTTVDLDTASLPRARPEGVTVRPGGPEDVPLLTEVYERVARTRNGLLTRRGGGYDVAFDGPLPEGIDAISVAEDADGPAGILAFGRGQGYGPQARLDVVDLLAVDFRAARALVAVLAGWQTVARAVRLVLLAGDAVSAALPVERGTGIERRPWMQRPVDVAAAVAARGWPAHVSGRVRFSLADDLAPWNAGDWELTVEDGAGQLRRTTGGPDLWLRPGGFAALYCAAVTGPGAVQAGLAGGSGDPTGLDLLGSGPPAALLDYF